MEGVETGGRLAGPIAQPRTSRSFLLQLPTREYFYDYAGQDPINGYDLNGESACSKGGWFAWTGLCHPIRSAKRNFHTLTRGAKAFFNSLGSAFVNFGDVASGVILGEGECFIAGAILAPETSGVALVGAAIVCGAAGMVEYFEIRKHLRRHSH